jgi:hypothetical protein
MVWTHPLGHGGVGSRDGGGEVGNFCEAEVENFGVAAFGDEDVGRLNVAMHYACAVGGIESVGDFNPETEELLEFQRLAGDDMF